MEIKRIENLSKEECKRYLQENPNGELATEVRKRLEFIYAAEEKARQQREKERKASVNLKNRWINVNKFLEERKYKNRRGLRHFLLLLIVICVIPIIVTLYYTNTTHCIYSKYRYEQCDYVYGVENILLKLNFLDCWHYSQEKYPIWDSYSTDDSLHIFVLAVLVLLLLYFVSSLFHSPLIGKIYNIESGTKNDKYRPIQNREGRSGLCKLGFARIKTLLPFQYELVVPSKENSFICRMNSKYGIYNVATKKFVLPIEYDEVYSMGESTISLKKDGHIYTFSYKGYRIID